MHGDQFGWHDSTAVTNRRKQSAFRGSGPATVRIYGDGLANARAIRFKQPGFTSIITFNDQFNIFAEIQADATVPLSGDRATFFDVLTPTRMTLFGAVDERVRAGMAELSPAVVTRAAGFSR